MLRGAREASSLLLIRKLEIEVTVLVDAYDNIQTLEHLADDFVDWLTTNEPKPLIFDREPDKIYYAMLDSQIDKEYFVTFGRATVKFTCPDPYKYAVKGTKHSYFRSRHFS